MSTVKLTADSGGGTVAIAGPSSTTGNAALTLTLPGTASGTIATTSTAGKILQVVSTTKTDQFSATTEDAWTDITGLSVAITPSATSSKVLFRAMVNVGSDQSVSVPAMRVLRDSTAIGVGDAAGTRGQATAVFGAADDWLALGVPIDVMDSPSSTSELTYKVQYYKSQSSTIYVNSSYRDTNGSGIDFRYSSIVYVMEIGA